MKISFYPQENRTLRPYPLHTAVENTEKTKADTKMLLEDQVTISEEARQAWRTERARFMQMPEQDAVEKEDSTVSGSVAINSGKLARRLAAAKTKAQVQAVIAAIQSDLSECKAGEAQNMTIDTASVQAAKNILNQAKQQLGKVDDRDATPEEKMAFSVAGLM